MSSDLERSMQRVHRKAWVIGLLLFLLRISLLQQVRRFEIGVYLLIIIFGWSVGLAVIHEGLFSFLFDWLNKLVMLFIISFVCVSDLANLRFDLFGNDVSQFRIQTGKQFQLFYTDWVHASALATLHVCLSAHPDKLNFASGACLTWLMKLFPRIWFRVHLQFWWIFESHCGLHRAFGFGWHLLHNWRIACFCTLRVAAVSTCRLLLACIDGQRLKLWGFAKSRCGSSGHHCTFLADASLLMD